MLRDESNDPMSMNRDVGAMGKCHVAEVDLLGLWRLSAWRDACDCCDLQSLSVVSPDQVSIGVLVDAVRGRGGRGLRGSGASFGRQAARTRGGVPDVGIVLIPR